MEAYPTLLISQSAVLCRAEKIILNGQAQGECEIILHPLSSVIERVDWDTCRRAISQP
jgi:hypothetical protein